MSLLPSRRLSARRAIWTAAAGAVVLACGFLACVTPPVGWEGAGRLQTLPMQQPDSAPPGIDGADDGGGDFDTGSDDTGSPDAGDDTGDDATDDGGNDADAAGDDTGASDAAADADGA